METTEELYSALGPEARAEAIRLAARLQTRGEESANLVAAAREAGIEERFLLEAVTRLRTPEAMPSPRRLPAAAAVASAALLIGVQGYAMGSSLLPGPIAHNWLVFILATAASAMCAAASERKAARWAGAALVGALWLFGLALRYGMVARAGSDFDPLEFLNPRFFAGPIVAEFLAAALGVGLADVWQRRRSRTVSTDLKFGAPATVEKR